MLPTSGDQYLAELIARVTGAKEALRAGSKEVDAVTADKFRSYGAARRQAMPNVARSKRVEPHWHQMPRTSNLLADEAATSLA